MCQYAQCRCELKHRESWRGGTDRSKVYHRLGPLLRIGLETPLRHKQAGGQTREGRGKGSDVRRQEGQMAALRALMRSLALDS